MDGRPSRLPLDYLLTKFRRPKRRLGDGLNLRAWGLRSAAMVGLRLMMIGLGSKQRSRHGTRVDTQGRKGGSDSTLEFGNHARVLGFGLVESIVISE